MSHTDVTGLRLSMLASGYRPVPVLRHDASDKGAGKRPTMDGWQKVCATADADEVRRWTGAQKNCLSTGILCGDVVGLDLDVADPALAIQVGALADAMLPTTPLLRIGRAPKSLRVFRAEGVHQKISTPALLLPDGTKVQVEALGVGNHFVAFGIHPDTKRPYNWPGQSPLDVPFTDLPVLPSATLHAFLAVAEAAMRAAGGKTEGERRGAEPSAATVRKPRTDRNTDFPPPTRKDVEEALRAVPNTHDWQGWVKIGAAIFDALADDGEDLFLNWSAQSSRNDVAATLAKWKSFRRSPMTTSEATLFYEARKNGWKPEREREIEREREAQRAGVAGADHDSAPAFDPGEPPDWGDERGYDEAAKDAKPFDPVDARVAEFNRKYMVVNDSGKAVIYEPAHDPILNRRYYRRMDFSDLYKLYLNDTVLTGVDKKGEPTYSQVAQVWARHKDRKQFIGGVTFNPSGSHNDPSTLNLWQGFAIKPKPGSWVRMKSHILEVICDGNRELYDYVLNWAARMVQFPAQRGEVAIVMKGVEGSGKGTLASALRRIMGQHALKISNSKHLTGNFNAHLRDCVFLFADEAFFAGDKAHVGVLKSIITEDSLTIEAKYANAMETPNYLHLMMASNEDWVVPAGPEARRFLVLVTAKTKVRNFPYFDAIRVEMESGGYEAMLHDLMQHDLTGFNVRDVPDTDGLQEQKKLSLDTSAAWWVDCLHRGYVYRSKLGLEKHFGEWREIETTEVLYNSYTEFAKAKNERHMMARETFGKFMVLMGGKYTQPRNVVVGEHMTDVLTNQYGDTKRQAALIEKARATGYRVGALEEARNAFTSSTNLIFEWEAADAD